jgi:prepilin-type N-terminal cleavage/methylation domain-containing protein/prepilin-type processing-associated H-X9-DG protein
MKCPRHYSRTGGFTLVELLVVIAIIGILAGMTLAGISKVRKNARSAVSRSNLRQIGIAIASYATEIGTIPPGSQGNWLFWYDAISPYLARPSSGGSRDATSPVLDSPCKAIPTVGVRCAFIANVNIMPDLANPAAIAQGKVATRPESIPRPAQTILVLDAEQIPDGTDKGLVKHINHQMPGVSDVDPANGDNSIGVLDNLDKGRASIRFRHRDDRFIQCLFADGHVSEIENGSLKKKYFQKAY